MAYYPQPPPPPPPRARRSLYAPPPPPRRRRGAGSIILAVLLVGVVVVGAIYGGRVINFLRTVSNFGNPIDLVAPPAPGTIAYKIQHGQRINVLALGYGGAENDAPYLTDSIMAISIDPANRRIEEISIPRDLWVSIAAWQDDRTYQQKINAAFEVGSEPRAFGTGALKPAYQGQDGPGHLAEATVGRVTGITFDRYVAVDFKAFRDVVNALGSITVHMDTPLDDCHYPDGGHGYVNHGVPVGYRCPPGAGIHFPAGTYQVNGEQALELARSRDAIEPEQANDFGRAKRQQMILSAIKAKAVSANALVKAPQLMDALQADFRTDMSLADIKALYDFGAKLPDSSIEHYSITDQDLAVGYNPPDTRGSCGPRDAYVLCPVDPTYRIWHTLFATIPVPPKTVAEKAPVQLVNASVNTTDLQTRTTVVMRQLGFTVADGVRHTSTPTSVIYDYSGGKYPQTLAYLESFFGAQAQPPPSPGVRGTFVPAPGELAQGIVVVMGSDFARRWIGTG
jgi:LCP family protein required for cell wall assembly